MIAPTLIGRAHAGGRPPHHPGDKDADARHKAGHDAENNRLGG
jgi:hypothetical protein